ncbi:MAG: efflux RND transporter periplasmic adaptor subunit [Gemmatimonadaceae bacterium]
MTTQAQPGVGVPIGARGPYSWESSQQWLHGSLRVALAAGALLLASLLVWRLAWRPQTVEVAVARHGTMAREVSGTGVVGARLTASISSRFTGNLLRVFVDEGDRVAAGQVLAVLEARDLEANSGVARASVAAAAEAVVAARAAQDKAEAGLDLARASHVRDSVLVAKAFQPQAALDVSTAGLQAALSAVTSARADVAAREHDSRRAMAAQEYADVLRSYANIVAPTAGIITERMLDPGSTVVPGSAILRMVDDRTIWVTVRVDESEASRIHPGQEAQIRLRSGGVIGGRVARVRMQADAVTREMAVDIALAHRPERFALDEEADVTIVAGKENGIVVPVTALLHFEGRAHVLAVRDGRAVSVPVRIGPINGRHALVVEGLVEGEEVVVHSRGIRPTARVRPRGTKAE